MISETEGSPIVYANSENYSDLLAQQNIDIRREIFTTWKLQQAEDRKERNKYSKCLLKIFLAQLGIMYCVLFLVAFDIIALTGMQFTAFFVSVFAQVSVLILAVVKYLFSENRFINILELLKDFKSSNNNENHK
jgi:flagellar biosynthesis protein FlhB